jgi:Zn-dependent protease with chaperone function
MTTQSYLSLSCKSCKKKSRLKKSSLLSLNASPSCSECQELLLPYFDKPFKGLSHVAFVHPLDRQMLEALRKFPGIDSLLKYLLSQSFELSMRLYHQGNFISVSKKQAKSLHDKLEKAVKILDLAFLPEFFLVQDSRANAYTFGVEKCAIAISSGCLDLLSDDEILCVIAHEVGHIKADHVLYKTASRILSSVAESIAQKTFGLGGMLFYPLRLALLRWDRVSELSSDRAALLVVKNPQIILSTLMKLAGGSEKVIKELNISSFIEQASAYEATKEEGILGSYISILNSAFTTHPFPIWRAQEIIQWLENGDYLSILSGDFATGDSKSNNSIKNNDNNISNTIDRNLSNLKSWYDKNFTTKDEQ